MSAELALVTGASRGIGRAIALKLSAAGYRLAISGRDHVRLAGVAQELGQDTFVHIADLCAPEEVRGLVEALRSSVGCPQILINNAGIAPTAKFERTDQATLDATLDLHLRAPFQLIREMLPDLRDMESGCIIQMASTAGLRGYQYTSAYCAAKHAMVGMSRALAEELRGSRVHCYAICPGFVDTDITRSASQKIADRTGQSKTEAMKMLGGINRIGRLHTVEEVADAVLKLCRERPQGCVYNLDTDPPCFVENP